MALLRMGPLAFQLIYHSVQTVQYSASISIIGSIDIIGVHFKVLPPFLKSQNWIVNLNRGIWRWIDTGWYDQLQPLWCEIMCWRLFSAVSSKTTSLLVSSIQSPSSRPCLLLVLTLTRHLSSAQWSRSNRSRKRLTINDLRISLLSS